MNRCACLAALLVAISPVVLAEPAPDELQGTSPPLIRLEHFTAASDAPVAEESAPDQAPLPGQPAAPQAAPRPESKQPSPAFERLQGLYDAGAVAPPAEQAAEAGGLLENSIRTFAWMLALCAFIIFAGYLVRKYASRTPLLASPQLGSVVGRLYLNPKTSIHFVRTGGKMLLLGVTPQQVTLLTELEEGVFDEVANRPRPPAPAAQQAAPRPADFLAELQENNRRLQQQQFSEDDDLVSLRSDIQRLQQSLQEKVRETQG